MPRATGVVRQCVSWHNATSDLEKAQVETALLTRQIIIRPAQFNNTINVRSGFDNHHFLSIGLVLIKSEVVMMLLKCHNIEKIANHLFSEPSLLIPWFV